MILDHDQVLPVQPFVVASGPTVMYPNLHRQRTAFVVASCEHTELTPHPPLSIKQVSRNQQSIDGSHTYV